MRSVVDHILEGIITIDATGAIITFNRAAEGIFGFDATEVVGRNVRVLMPDPDRSRHDEYIANYVHTGVRKIIGIGREVIGQRKDGSVFPMELGISEFRLGGKRYFTGIVRDITERKRLEGELLRKVKELAEADRQKNEFLAMLGHELRNPLGPMRNALYLMRRSGADAALVDEAQGMIERQLQHLMRLVDDLLDISRIIRGKIELRRERIDVAAAVRRGLETAQPTVDASGHVVDVALPPQPVWVMGDLIRLAQVVSNLVVNAAKYTVTPGRISCELRREGDTVALAVRDQGEGIEPHLLPRVFDLFVQGDQTLARSQGGLGIGLTLVQRIVKMHGGRVTASSAGRGYGSEFVVYLPLLPDLAGATTAADAAAERMRRRVLVVDDNADAADSMAQILRLFGHETTCAYDGVSALRAAESYDPEVIVLDIGLPGIDGYEAARRIRATPELASCLLIAVTGYGQEEDRALARAAGFDHHLTKPVDPEALQRLIIGHEPVSRADGAPPVSRA